MKKGFALGSVVAVLLCLAPVARANYDPIGGGTTRIALDGSFLSLLKKGGVTVSAKAGAKRKGNALIMPVIGGKSDPTIKKAEVEQEGTLVFAKGKRKVPFRHVELKVKRTPLFAKVGGGQLKLATSKTTTATRAGFGTQVKATGLELTAKVATRLNKKLRTKKLFKEGELIGTVTSSTEAQRVTILEQAAGSTVTPDPAILAKFRALFVSLNPISPAELAPGPILKFPIAIGGQIAPNASEGTLRLGGAIELLQIGAGQVFHKEYWLDLGLKSATAEVDIEPTPAFPGKLGRIGVFGINMAAASVSSNPKARTISATGAPLSLEAETAKSFNDAFAEGKPVFNAGETFGTLNFSATAQ